MILFVPNKSLAQIYSVNGIVIDSISKTPLPFVNIILNNSKIGCTSDIDGKFSIQSNYNDSLNLSYVGYFSKTVKVDKSNISISMTKKNIDLSEITILPGENPALRIIEKTIENKDLNNPQNLSSFSYQSYNKMVFTADLKGVNTDSIKKTNDSSSIRLLNFFEKQDLFIIESVCNRFFLKPSNNKEIVIGSKVSGFSNPSFTLLASQFQSFSFYSELIKISDKNYLNPLAKGSINKYLYLLEDTIYKGSDTVYIISFHAMKNKNFDALKGLLYINTNGYALQNVVAEPEEPFNGTTVKIQQMYELIDEKYWFPTQQNADIIFNNIMLGKYKVIGIGRTYLKDIKVNIPLSKKDFDRLEFKIDNNATEKETDFWTANRIDSLTNKNKNTYRIIDSIGKAGKFDKKVKSFEALITGKLPYKFLDFDINKFLMANNYEGIRIGIDAQTNSKLSNIISVGSNVAYGFKDKQLKYGSNISLSINKNKDINISLSYNNDVEECGSMSFYYDNKTPIQLKQTSESYRKLVVDRMYKYEKISLAGEFRLFQYTMINIGLINRHITEFASIQWALTPEPLRIIKNNFSLSELCINLKFAYKEKYMENFKTTI